MKLIAPDYYKEFACIKGDCRHSCCIGWEIDIDDETLAYYQSMGGEIGKRLKENISFDGGCAHFRLGQGERCPFLNEEGLCDLIIAQGEGALCQICDDHPRFRNFYSDREEIGLGLCCEAAAKLILGRREPVCLETIEDDGGDESLSEEEADVLELRDAIITFLQDRSLSMEQRTGNMLSYLQMDIPPFDFSHWSGFLCGLERLDEQWAAQLAGIHLSPGSTPVPASMQLPYEQLMVYLVYRHVNADTDDLSGRIAYCVFIWQLIRAMHGDGSFKALCALARLYSSEIEYSDENMDAVIDELHRLYPQI